MNWFYSYELRRKDTGAHIGYGDGIAKNWNPQDENDLDHLRYLILNGTEAATREALGTAQVHILSICKLLSVAL